MTNVGSTSATSLKNCASSVADAVGAVSGADEDGDVERTASVGVLAEVTAVSSPRLHDHAPTLIVTTNNKHSPEIIQGERQRGVMILAIYPAGTIRRIQGFSATRSAIFPGGCGGIFPTSACTHSCGGSKRRKDVTVMRGLELSLTPQFGREKREARITKIR